jgi:hypothetical protein
MRSTNQAPIMTNAESTLQRGANAYAKPATAFNILRETVLGRELFDFAFKEYAERWKFKRPTPADFFRTMEDALTASASTRCRRRTRKSKKPGSARAAPPSRCR